MWLIRANVLSALEKFNEHHPVIDAAAQKEWEASAGVGRVTAGDPSIMSRAGKTAEIKIDGVLTRNRSYFAYWAYGANTAYSDIISALNIASSDPSISKVVLRINSPGGNVDGLFDTLAALQAFNKPLSVIASEACSAAYGIAAVAGSIQATGPSASFGSVGVAVSYQYDETVVDITSTNAPNKRPDISTEEGKAVVRQELDAFHDLFVDAISRGRNVSVDDINADFGRGGVLLAAEAKKAKMIDSIAQQPNRTSGLNSQAAQVADTKQGKKSKMEESELKTQFPELYAAIIAKGEALGRQEGMVAGVAQGTEKERKRVQAHLKMAETTGAPQIAHEAIANGKSVLDEDIHAEYMSAALNRADKTARTSDAETALSALAGASKESVGLDFGDQIIAVMNARSEGVR